MLALLSFSIDKFCWGQRVRIVRFFFSFQLFFSRWTLYFPGASSCIDLFCFNYAISLLRVFKSFNFYSPVSFLPHNSFITYINNISNHNFSEKNKCPGKYVRLLNRLQVSVRMPRPGLLKLSHLSDIFSLTHITLRCKNAMHILSSFKTEWKAFSKMSVNGSMSVFPISG